MQMWGCCVNGVTSRRSRELTAAPTAETGLQTAGEAGPVLTRHLFGILTKAFGRPRTPSPLSALLLSRNLLFFKVFLPKCDVLQAPQPISLLLHRTDETIHLPAPHSLAPPCPHSPTHPRTWLRPRSPGGRRRTDCLNQRRRLGGAAAFPPPVQTTACRPILPRGRNIFEAAPEFGERKIRVVSDLILTQIEGKGPFLKYLLEDWVLKLIPSGGDSYAT